MEINKAIIFGILGIIVGLISGLLIFRPTEPIGFAGLNRFGNTEITTATVATTSASSVLSAKGGRMYVRIDNPDGTNPVYCVLGETAEAADGKGIKIEAGEYYEIQPGNLYTGQISCIGTATGADVILSIIEK